MTSKEEHEATANIVGMICVLLFACFLLGSVTYGCTRPTESVPINRELHAQRIIENNKMVSCARARGSWLPVTTRLNTVEMSCVMAETLPLVEKMNTAD